MKEVVFFRQWVQVIIIIGSRINRAVHSTKIEKVQILLPGQLAMHVRNKTMKWKMHLLPDSEVK